MENWRTDVLVVGSGAGGMAAALSAAERGARVMILEKRRVIGGISNFPATIFAVESRLQRDYNIPVSKDEAFRLFMSAAQWRPNARLVRAFIDKTAGTIDWLEQLGVEFEMPPFFFFPEGRLVTHVIKQRGLMGDVIKIMRTKAVSIGVDIRIATPVRKLLKDGDRIVGASAEDQSGANIQVNAKAVIVASGGYANNREMVKEHGWDAEGDLPALSPVKLTGDGILMAWEAGAASDGMSIAFRYDMPSQGGHARRWDFTLIAHQPYLWVNQHGERFFDEGIVFSGAYTANALLRQKNRCAYLIFDGNTKKYLEDNGWDNPMFPGSPKIADIDGMLKNYLDKGDVNIFISDSVLELSQRIGVNPERLQKTVDEYNTFCDKGHDDLFAKDPRYLQPVRDPLFYAFRIMPMAYGTVGGIKINENAEAITPDDEAIPGLYAVGDCANGPISHNFWLAFALGGTPVSYALNTGRIAGENASDYIRKFGL